MPTKNRKANRKFRRALEQEMVGYVNGKYRAAGGVTQEEVAAILPRLHRLLRHCSVEKNDFTECENTLLHIAARANAPKHYGESGQMF